MHAHRHSELDSESRRGMWLDSGFRRNGNEPIFEVISPEYGTDCFGLRLRNDI